MASEVSARPQVTVRGRHAAPRAGSRRAPAEPASAGQAGRAAPAPRPRGWRLARLARHPLTAICAVQAALSLTLVWSNTAFTDEADYLRLGHVIIRSWLHGAHWPQGYGQRVLSGSPLIYPPLGAAADALGGLAGARILSLAFMLAATVLVYHAASRLLGRAEAVIAAALFGLSEPVIRLAFATYDAMSVCGIALAAWLAVLAGRAGSGRRQGWLTTAAGAALALACATAYSALVTVPVVIAFAFLAWLSGLGARRAAWRAGWLAGVWLAVFCALIAVSRSWAGLAFSVINRQVSDYQGVTLIVGDIARYSGLIIVTALVGAVLAARALDPGRAWLTGLLAAASLVVPAAQLYNRTAWALDKHLAYGIWFAAIAAGYGCRALAERISAGRARRRAVAAVAGLAVLALAATADWGLARRTYRAWPDATAFVAAMRSAANATPPPERLFASAQKRVAAYYTWQGEQWWRWTVKELSVDPAPVPRSGWTAYYRSRLAAAGYGVIALFYACPAGMTLPASLARGVPPGSPVLAELLRLRNLKASEPGVPALTRALERDPGYRLVAAGPYDSDVQHGVFAIWRLAGPPAG